MNTYITQIDGKWYAFAGNMEANQVCSIGRDNPNGDKHSKCYFAKWNDAGIRYVSSPSPNRFAAYRRAMRNGNYNGEV